MTKSRLFVISSDSIAFNDDHQCWQDASRKFAERQALMLPGILEEKLLARLCSIGEEACFAPYDLGSIGQEQVETKHQVSRSLNFLLSRPALLRRLESLTGCGPLASIGGNLGRISVGTGEHLGWHDDMNEPSRKIAISICLSEVPYEGGEFELRAKKATTRFAHQHRTPGDAVIFRIDAGLEHRVKPVLSGGPRLVYSGWFI